MADPAEQVSMVELVARAIREEILRQYRDDERRKCPAGAAYYEEHIAPDYLARAAIEAIEVPSKAMLNAGAFHLIQGAGGATAREIEQAARIWKAMARRAAADAKTEAEFAALAPKPCPE